MDWLLIVLIMLGCLAWYMATRRGRRLASARSRKNRPIRRVVINGGPG